VTGSINPNNQRNSGKTVKICSDNGPWFYEIECLDCHDNTKLTLRIFIKEKDLDVREVDHRYMVR
jgi:hypothetical protein